MTVLVPWLILACNTGFSPEIVRAPAPPPSVQAGLLEQMPAETMRARLFSSSDKPRLYNFWATWCPPCRQEMPRIKAWAQAHPEVEVVLINVDLVQLRIPKVEPFLRSNGLTELTNWQLDAVDPAMDMAHIVPGWAQTLPVTLLVNTDGEVTESFHRVLHDQDLARLP